MERSVGRKYIKNTNDYSPRKEEKAAGVTKFDPSNPRHHMNSKLFADVWRE